MQHDRLRADCARAPLEPAIHVSYVCVETRDRAVLTLVAAKSKVVRDGRDAGLRAG